MLRAISSNSKHYPAIPSNIKQPEQYLTSPSNIKHPRAISSHIEQPRAISSNTKQPRAISNNIYEEISVGGEAEQLRMPIISLMTYSAFALPHLLITAEENIYDREIWGERESVQTTRVD